MKFLLDTHVFLWYVLGDARLSDRNKKSYHKDTKDTKSCGLCDRILVTQAMNRSLFLVSADTKFNPYSIQRIWS